MTISTATLPAPAASRIAEIAAGIAAPVIDAMPDVPDGHGRTVILLGLGCTATQTAAITGYHPRHVELLASRYRKEIADVAAGRDTAVVAVLEQVQAMIGDKISYAVQRLDLNHPTTGDVVKLAAAMESIRRAAYDVRESAHAASQPPGGRYGQVALQDIDAALNRARRVQGESANAAPQVTISGNDSSPNAPSH